MGEQKRGRGPRPALRKILLWLLSLFLLVLAVSLAGLAAALHSSREYQWGRTVYAVEGQLSRLDGALSAVNLSLTELLLSNEEVQKVLSAEDVHERNVAARQLSDRLELQGRSPAGSFNFFFYELKNGTEVFRYDGRSDYGECSRLRKAIKESLQASSHIKESPAWEPVIAGGSVYLLQSYQLNGAVAASWVPCDSALSFMSGVPLSDQGFYLVMDQNRRPVTPEGGKTYPTEEDWEGYSQEFVLPHGNMTLLVADKPGAAQQAWLTVMWLFALTLLIVAVFSIYTLTYFQRYIQAPFERLQSHVNDYASERHTAKRKGFAELEMAMSAFDALVGQINELKIEQYEEEISLAKTQLEYFQLQIKPHFFVNAFSVIYGMAQKKEFERIQEFCLKLSDYVRYLFQNGLFTVPLEKELASIQDYLGIQNIRFRTQSAVDEEIPPGLLAFELPPLLLLTFVENAVKHSHYSRGMLVTIKAQAVDAEPPQVRFTVAGSGSAFSSEDLEALNRLTAADQEDGGHIGVRNTHKRLSLMYGVEYSLRFYNQDGRSVVEIILPWRSGGEKN